MHGSQHPNYIGMLFCIDWDSGWDWRLKKEGISKQSASD